LIEHIDIKHGTGKKQNRGAKIWQGADDTRTGGKYVPVMKKNKNEPVEVQNAKWLASKERKMAAKEAAEQSASL
jgi:tRNA pseudouridine38/39 synthase